MDAKRTGRRQRVLRGLAAMLPWLVAGAWIAADGGAGSGAGSAVQRPRDGGDAQVGAAHAPLRATAEALADRLARRGRLSVMPAFEFVRTGGANGFAVFDARQRRCIVRLDRSLDPAALATRQLIYHELSHCELFARPGLFAGWGGLDPAGSRMLDDLLLLDLADPPEDRPALRWYGVAHETYADLRALALMREEGVPPAALATVAAARDDRPFDAEHRTGPALRTLMTVPDAVLLAGGGAAMEPIVRRLTAHALVDDHLRLGVPHGADTATVLQALIDSHMRTALARRARGEADADLDAFFERGATHPDGLSPWPTLAWLVRWGTRSGRTDRSEGLDAAVTAWQHAVYGPPEARAQTLRRSAGVLAGLIADAEHRLHGGPPAAPAWDRDTALAGRLDDGATPQAPRPLP